MLDDLVERHRELLDSADGEFAEFIREYHLGAIDALTDARKELLDEFCNEPNEVHASFAGFSEAARFLPTVPPKYKSEEHYFILGALMCRLVEGAALLIVAIFLLSL